jgi:hypothetical protein
MSLTGRRKRLGGTVGLLWTIASYAASRLTVGTARRPRIALVVSLALVAIACLLIYRTAGDKAVWISAITLQAAILVFATVS